MDDVMRKGDDDWVSDIKNLYILMFSVNGIINIILYDLINVYAKIWKYESLYDCMNIGNI